MASPTTLEAKGLTLADVEALYARPLLDLVFEAAGVHRAHHDPQYVQCSQLLSIKTGGCPEDCGYCSQSSRHDADLVREELLSVEKVVEEAKQAKANGADRFCMGAAWRGPKKNEEFERVLEMVRQVKALGLETCVTLGMLDESQANALDDAGLDYYNHNLDTGASHFGEIITTHTLQDRLDTLGHVRNAGINVCSGGILGMGEGPTARCELLLQLAQLDPQPESVPINNLVPIEGTPLGKTEPVDWSVLVRTTACARILMPEAVIRLSAGRGELTDEAQAMCFLAGANSIFCGTELLTTPNPEPHSDAALLSKLGLKAERERS